MFHWLHHLFNPHCEDCREDNVCQACEVLKRQLEFERAEKRDLLRKLLEPTIQAPEVYSEDELKPVTPKFKPFRVIQQELERRDRDQAKELLRQKEAEMQLNKINKLEAELEVGESK